VVRSVRHLRDTNILIDVLRGEQVARAWLEQQQRPAISVITWIDVLVGCRAEETPVDPGIGAAPLLPMTALLFVPLHHPD